MGNSLTLVLSLLAAMLILIPLNGLIINALGFLMQKMKLKRELIILVVVGFTVTLPELMIAIQAVNFNQPELALGNALGTGLVLMTLVAGIVAIYNKNFKTNKVFSRNHLVFMTLAASLNIILAFDGRISRMDGVILIITYLVYIFILLAQKSNFSIPQHLNMSPRKVILNLGIVVFGMIAAYFAAYFINHIGREIYLNTNFSLFFIGLILVAPLGAVPELVFEMELNQRGKSTLTLGELFTSLVSNTTLVIGITALMAPINVSTNVIYYFTAFFFVVLLLLFNSYVHSRNSLNWREGIILVVGYIIFLLSTITLMFS
jgi:cation:H+ antiporter